MKVSYTGIRQTPAMIVDAAVEQDADVVMFIYRDDVYYTEEEWDQRHPDRPYPKNIAEIIVAKHRNGPIGTVSLYFRSTVVRFESLDQSVASREFA